MGAPCGLRRWRLFSAGQCGLLRGTLSRRGCAGLWQLGRVAAVRALVLLAPEGGEIAARPDDLAAAVDGRGATDSEIGHVPRLPDERVLSSSDHFGSDHFATGTEHRPVSIGSHDLRLAIVPEE